MINSRSIVVEVQKRNPFPKILELVGVVTLDSLRGRSDKRTFEQFTPLGSTPCAVKLTTYKSTPQAVGATPIEEIAYDIVKGKMELPIKTFTLDQVMEAHQLLDQRSWATIIILP
ncbi:zinc-binding oxidoreductase [Penicillium chermesinum]|nr:zinc-binding oxidoreductase [Penicillium chermesinum]